MITDFGPPAEVYYDAQGHLHPYDPADVGLGACSPCQRRQLAGTGAGGVAMLGLLVGFVGLWAAWFLTTKPKHARAYA